MNGDWRKKAEDIRILWEEKHKKASKLWEAELWGEFFRVLYISFEIKVESLYIYENRQMFPEKSDIFSILTTILSKYNIQRFDERSFHRWRELRNEIAHRDKEINQNTAKNAKTFFEKSDKILDDLLEKHIQPMFDYHGIPLVKPDYDVLMEIESMVGCQVPNYHRFGYNDLFGFSQDDGFLTLLAIDGRTIERNMKILTFPEFLKKIYIDGNNFPKIVNWLKSITPPHTYGRSTGINVIVVGGDKWTNTLHPNIFNNKCSIRQTSLNLIKQDDELFNNQKTKEIKEKVLELSKRFGRIYIDELAGLLSTDVEGRKNNKYQPKANKQLIIATIKEMINNKEIKGIFFDQTFALVFDLS
jgi:hypothetical protein